MIEMKEYKEYDLSEKEYKMLKSKYNLTKILEKQIHIRVLLKRPGPILVHIRIKRKILLTTMETSIK